ncbi:nucleotidyltransferase family protein [Nitrogeniibacter aestuarii]|uniref:nucleotidyltransferase family protein n=1 Tax=Nitrogeniibacter aestuarii TaxID=2815343 RepID=UPI001E62553D|nr:nucleotidyltransferase family protein [Nitrogeniibacter aestuarii]
MNVAAVLLAAGLGRRFDPAGRSDKLLAPWHDGKPVLWHSASNVLAAVRQVVAVVRPEHELRQAWLERLGIRVVVSESAHLGMGAALSAGVAALRGVDGCLVCLGDMPAVRVETIARMRDGLDTADAIVAPRFDGAQGHPVGFGARWFDELRALEADRGPRHLLSRDEVRWIEVNDPGCRFDIDQPSDLALRPGDVSRPPASP